MVKSSPDIMLRSKILQARGYTFKNQSLTASLLDFSSLTKVPHVVESSCDSFLVYMNVLNSTTTKKNEALHG